MNRLDWRTQMRDPGQNLPYLMDIDEIAEHLGVSSRHVRRLVQERRIPYLKWGHLLRFDPVEVDAWLVGCRREALRPPA